MNHKQESSGKSNSDQALVWEKVILEGHIIDSLLLPKVLDLIISLGGSFEFEEVEIGKKQQDDSHVVIKVGAENPETLDEIIPVSWATRGLFIRSV
ncbi:MAG: hypothetical protein R3C11_25420 [Planctomycetaceae bacterium]